MAHASVSWACGRHPSTFNQYIEYGPVAVVANDGDTNNEGRSATDNDVEIGDGRLRLLPWHGKHTALFAIHHPHYTSASFFLISRASGHRVQFAVTSPANVFREPHPGTGERANGTGASPRL